MLPGLEWSHKESLNDDYSHFASESQSSGEDEELNRSSNSIHSNNASNSSSGSVNNINNKQQASNLQVNNAKLNSSSRDDNFINNNNTNALSLQLPEKTAVIFASAMDLGSPKKESTPWSAYVGLQWLLQPRDEVPQQQHKQQQSYQDAESTTSSAEELRTRSCSTDEEELLSQQSSALPYLSDIRNKTHDHLSSIEAAPSPITKKSISRRSINGGENTESIDLPPLQRSSSNNSSKLKKRHSKSKFIAPYVSFRDLNKSRNQQSENGLVICDEKLVFVILIS